MFGIIYNFSLNFPLFLFIAFLFRNQMIVMQELLKALDEGHPEVVFRLSTQSKKGTEGSELVVYGPGKTPEEPIPLNKLKEIVQSGESAAETFDYFVKQLEV